MFFLVQIGTHCLRNFLCFALSLKIKQAPKAFCDKDSRGVYQWKRKDFAYFRLMV